MLKNKIVSADEAVAIIRDRDTICTSGFVGVGTPDELLIALAKRYRETRHPSDLTLMFAAAPGDSRERGLNRLDQDGLLKRVIGGHWALVPRLGELALKNRIEAYNLPLGCISHLYRNIAARGPGTISKVGLRTFVDPRLEGGRLNAATTEDLVELIDIGGEEWLRYRSFPIHVALLRGTTADPSGNITMEREALTLDNLAMAMAAKNSRGFVVVQVERIAAAHSLNPREVQIPGILVDCVVVAEPENHVQTYGTGYSHAFSGRQRVPMDRVEPLALDERKVIARRCAFELPPGGVINLGIGMPESVAAVATEEHMLQYLTLTAEPGIIGGMPQGGLNFGTALNPDAVIHQNQQFDFYDGGGLDLACLGMAQADAAGNVNVSRFGNRLAGAGGFINISQSAKKLVFAGTFTCGGLKLAIEDGALHILREGTSKKFIRQVEQVTFSGDYAAETGQPVYYVTERCVLQRTPAGVELIEVAPGIDIERDILAHMEFAPLIRDVRAMDGRIFRDGPMGLLHALLGRSLADRLSYDAARNTLFVNFEGFEVRTVEDVDLVRREVERVCQAAGKPVALVANYDGFHLDPMVGDAYFSMIAYLEKRYYASASRYTTSAFMRLKLGEALADRHVAPHIFETQVEAQRFADMAWRPGETAAAAVGLVH
ncbi:acyl CoA:acetate/3-ketoacid CoA transferase [Bradyrhizobium sp. U87765 SZCCT0131]|uniref:acyl CoA:acetate/3-ketoacid CoA transferase n=1 Tax=unclassified Bradyrhizobium TaxID=2631580 RepID=UPI001BABA3DF|nr:MULTISPECIES: acyl CoA:acetate/3-ketoacid CoA transferase [unclassified Bradyrhizobium]MBR1217686.1 acyl CoA:acetate/3-ketoacid CoA transferase [Bradyrhizobium sp. U87765 SZCCT0131]MBR1261368.1 acyl CoA:acetate/3-ketoacid CoA transferase [Bradyrhizobium sp. U87765 SZCCT0134]MBR1303184.1 acyl CoA:acetate/3-ketoacid CoA transferase [Bradyrhizobium sp. U87765 SZCCT0110]MBR1318790.1 acyl CoA:acetate/3-ketoacid CoA transferase [Bradyrhizobium sp. U87765 SZCCT0109]MBR1347115.1 acyl CoA:acetate/3-